MNPRPAKKGSAAIECREISPHLRQRLVLPTKVVSIVRNAENTGVCYRSDLLHKSRLRYLFCNTAILQISGI